MTNFNVNARTFERLSEKKYSRRRSARVFIDFSRAARGGARCVTHCRPDARGTAAAGLFP